MFSICSCDWLLLEVQVRVYQLVLFRQHLLQTSLVSWVAGRECLSAALLFPREVATLLWCLPHLSSFLHRAIAFYHSSKLNLPPNPSVFQTLWPRASLSFISVSAKLFSGLPHSFSHSFANFKACKTNDLKKKMASSPILKLGGCGIPISYNIHLWCNFILCFSDWLR